MTLPWFRFFHEALDDPKVQKLDPATFKHWVNLLCLACRHEGRLPSNPDIAFNLRIDEIALESLLDRLLIATLIEVRKGGANGSYIAMHGWDERQYKSDSSTERVKRFRKRYRNVTETVSETGPDTDTDSDTEIPPLHPANGAEIAAFTISDFVESWNETAAACGLPKLAKLTEARKRAFRVRQREYPDIEDWRKAFRTLRTRQWMHGDNRTGWQADPDFFLQAKSFTKLVEGAYGKAD